MADGTSSPSDASNQPESDASGFTLDLSTGKAPTRRKRKRKGPAPVVQQTINLSTPKSEKPAEDPNAPARSSKGTPGKKPGGRRKERPAPRSGNSLADLLDAETLARLRGDE
ncbi:MAG: hypothetical protein Rubg2KO_20620 [Rubricoccaceae bacterium]